MLKALGKLTKSKVVPASKDQINGYEQKIQERDKIFQECNKVDAILKELSESYKQHKKDFAPNRYEAHKLMITTAAQKLRHTHLDVDNGRGRGMINTLLTNSKAFASSMGPIEKFSDMGSFEIEEALGILKEEIQMLKRDYRSRRDLIEDLDKMFTDSKGLNKIDRYARVKLAIKSTIESYNKLPSTMAGSNIKNCEANL